MSAPSLSTEASNASGFPSRRFSPILRQFASSVKTYVDTADSGKLTSTLASAKIFVGNASNVATAVSMSGDATISNAGALTIANSAITNAKVSASAAIDYSKMATMTGDVTMTANASAIGAGKVLKAMLGSGISASHICTFSGANVATAGGDDTETVSITGLLATDSVSVTLRTKGATPRTILTATPSTDTLTIVFSGDPSTDHAFDYQCFRATT